MKYLANGRLTVWALLPVLLLLGSPALAKITGEWLTEGGKSKVRIENCGEKLCGSIVWLKEPNSKTGGAKTDLNNPDEKLQMRPILGLRLIGGFIRGEEDNVWEDGEIYNPEDGETYSCTLTLQENGTLEVRGYIGWPIFGKTQIWTRAK